MEVKLIGVCWSSELQLPKAILSKPLKLRKAILS